MANAVFTTKVSPSYNDLPELQYHFPQTYLRAVQQAEGDLIVYYEPRREDSNQAGRGGRQSYFAVARVASIGEDPKAAGFHYAYMADYLEFDHPVPFRAGGLYFESALQKDDGSTNKGAFGRSVRIILPEEFQAIVGAGFADASLGTETRVAEQPPLERTLTRTLQERTFRDKHFSRIVKRAYEGSCAMTGLKLVNESRFEVHAAHIKSVEDLGPDSPRNGIALSRTVHWLFDEGALSISESGDILVAKRLVPDKVRRLLNEDGKVRMPSDVTLRPHEAFLSFHRSRFRG